MNLAVKRLRRNDAQYSAAPPSRSSAVGEFFVYAAKVYYQDTDLGDEHSYFNGYMTRYVQY